MPGSGPSDADPGVAAAAPPRLGEAMDVPQTDVDLARALIGHLRLRSATLVPSGRAPRRLVPVDPTGAPVGPDEPDIEAIAADRFDRPPSRDGVDEIAGRPELVSLDVTTPGGRRVAVVLAARDRDDPWTDVDVRLAHFLVDYFSTALIAVATRPMPPVASRPGSGRAQRRTREAAIRDAAHRGELTLLFQPEIDMRTGTVLSAEALVRWDHPQLGRLTPDAFIEDAERSDLIDVIDLWVLAESVRAAAAWPSAPSAPSVPPVPPAPPAPSREEVTVRVNVSPALVGADGFVGTVRGLLAEHGLPGRRLCVELTERLDLPADGSVETAVSALAELGVSTAIDDLAVGYSSLSRLRRLHAHTLKIDRSLVTGIADDRRAQAIVAGLARIAADLGAEVVAEGIETPAEAEVLLGIGVVRAQGHLFARPMSDADFRALLVAGPPAPPLSTIV